MGKDSSAIPDQVTASGLRRAELAASEDVVAAASVGKVKTGGQVADDWVDEKEVRRHTGEEKRFHDRVDAAHGERKVHGTPSAKAAEMLESKDRRPGFGVECACPSPLARRSGAVRARRRNACGMHDSCSTSDVLTRTNPGPDPAGDPLRNPSRHDSPGGQRAFWRPQRSGRVRAPPQLLRRPQQGRECRCRCGCRAARV